MKTIWKFAVPIEEEFSIKMPWGAKILAVQPQDGKQAQLWAEVDSTNESRDRAFALRGTGHILGSDEGDYVGTFQAYGGTLVLHLFDKSRGAY